MKNSDIDDAQTEAFAGNIEPNITRDGCHGNAFLTHCGDIGYDQYLSTKLSTATRKVPGGSHYFLKQKSKASAKDLDEEDTFYNKTSKPQEIVNPIVQHGDSFSAMLRGFGCIELHHKHHQRIDQGDFPLVDKSGAQGILQELLAFGDTELVQSLLKLLGNKHPGKIDSGDLSLFEKFGQQAILQQLSAVCHTELVQPLMKLLRNYHLQRKDQGNVYLFDKVGQQDTLQQSRTSSSIPSHGDKHFKYICFSQMKESGILDTMSTDLLEWARKVLGEELFQVLFQLTQSTHFQQSLQPDYNSDILLVEQLLARIVARIQCHSITGLNNKPKDKAQTLKLQRFSQSTKTPKSGCNTFYDYLIHYQDDKKQAHKQTDTVRKVHDITTVLVNVFLESESKYKLPEKAPYDTASGKIDSRYQSEQKDVGSRKVTKPKPTADGSGNGTTLKDTHRSTESSKKIEQTLSSKTDDASDGGHSSHTQLQPPVQSKPQSESLPGKQLDFDKEEGAKPAEASGGQVSHQEQTKAEPKTHENFPQLKVLAALTWERASSGTESSDSSDSSDPYEGMYSGCSSCSNRDDSAVSSTATGNSKPPDVKDSTSSRSSDTLQDLSSRGRHLVLPASVQGTTREHDPEMLDYSEETTGLSQNENIMLISVLMVENPSLIMSVCTSSEDDETVHTVFHFSTPVTVSSFDSQEQHQSYHEYIPIVSPIHTDMPKFIQDFASQRKKMPQDGETSTLSLTSNPRSGPILAHPEDETGPFVMEEQWVVIRERQGATGYTARPQHTGSIHCSEGTPMQTSVLHHVQWQESTATHEENNPTQTTESHPHQRPNCPAQILSHVPGRTPLRASIAQATALSGSSHESAGIHMQSALPQTGHVSGSFAFSHDEERAPAQTTVVEMCQVSGSHVPERTHTQTATLRNNCTGGCSEDTGLAPFVQRHESPRTQAQAALPNAHQSCWSLTDSSSAPIQRLPPIVVHAAGALPPWATTTARIDLSRAANREYAQLRSRRATYDDDWSYNSGIDPANMALSGFFHDG